MTNLNERSKAVLRDAMHTLAMLNEMDISALSVDELINADELMRNAKSVVGAFAAKYEGVIIENLGFEIDASLKSEVAIRFMESRGYSFVDSIDKIAPYTFINYPKDGEVYRDISGGLSYDLEETGLYKSPAKFVNFPNVPEEFTENYPSFNIGRITVHIPDIRMFGEETKYDRYRFPGEVRSFVIFK